jgi:FHS family glucose/mannose:H+ symporter-like MFS transporter
MNRSYTTFLCCLLMFLFGMVFTIISPLLIEVARTYSLDMASSGIIFTAISLGFVVFVFFGGFLSEKIGKKILISISLASLSVFLISVFFAFDFISLCVIMVFVGGFGGILESLGSSLAAEINTERSSYYQNMIQVFFGIGAVIGPAGAGLLVKYGMNWKICYLILGFMSLVLFVMFSLNKLELKKNFQAMKIKDIIPVFKDIKFVIICFCVLIYTGAEVGSWGWMSTFLKQNLGFTVMNAGFAVGLFWIAMTAGRIFWGEFSLKHDLSLIIIILSSMSFVMTVVSVLVTGIVIVWFVIALLGFSFSSIWPFLVAYGGEHKKSSSGIVFSALIGAGGIGGTVVPYLMGIVGEKINTKVSMLVPAIMFFVIAVIFVIFKFKKNASNNI